MSVQTEQDQHMPLDKVLELFPGISHEFVEHTLHTQHSAAAETNHGSSRCRAQDFVENILAHVPYPKQNKAKRKREDGEDGHNEWLNSERPPVGLGDYGRGV